MKQSPQQQRLEQIMRSSKIVAGGLLGDDPRSVDEIIAADGITVERAGHTISRIAQRMQQISDLAAPGLGTWVDIDDSRRAMVQEAAGNLICPWPHPGVFRKTVTIVQRKDSKVRLQWSRLSIHMIGEHGFFEGSGSIFRIDPKSLIAMIF